MPIDVFPDDIETLRALVVAAFTERDAAIAERNRALSQIDRLRHLLRQLSRAHFGKRSEKLDPDQLLLALEDIEQAIAESEMCQRRSKNASAGRSKNTSVMLARRPPNWGPFLQASGLGGIIRRRFRAGTA